MPAEWWFRPTGATDDIAVPACADHLECDFAPPSDGVMFAQSWVGSGYVGGEVEIGRPAVTIKIDTVYGPNPNGSFTTREGEQQVTLKATVAPATRPPLTSRKARQAVFPCRHRLTPQTAGKRTGTLAI